MTNKENNPSSQEEPKYTSYQPPPIWKTEPLEQVEIARQFANPIRHELLKRTLKEIQEGLKVCPEEVRAKLEVAEKYFHTIIERLNKAAVHFEGFTADEIQVCVNTFASEYYKYLHSDDLNEVLEKKIEGLALDEERLQSFLTLKKYQFPAEKYDAEALLSRVRTYKKYLQTILSYYIGNVPRFVDPSKANETNNDMDKEVYLVEELELRLSIEAVRYKRHFDGFPPVFEFDPQHYNRFISGPLLNEYIQCIYERTKKLNNHEVNRYLNISYSQFQTHNPSLRKEAIKEQYWKDYCYPNPPYMPYTDIGDRDNQYLEHIFKWYEKHFHLFKEATEKALADFKAGLLGSHSAPIKENGTMNSSINYESFNNYIKHLKYNYPYKTSVFDFKYSMKDFLDYLKTEILDNIIILSKDNRKAYLNKIRYELQNQKQHAWATHETIKVWLDKYEVETDEDLREGKKHNELYQILTSEPPTMDEEFEEGFIRDTNGIQRDFYNYYYGFYINEAVKFIDEQIKEHSPNSSHEHQSNTEQKALQVQNQRLKTGLSVPQLALLFKLLNELKPAIFNINSEAELHRFISANFETKRSNEEGISTDKLRILFNQPDAKAAEFWEKHFYTFIAEIKKIK